MKDKEHKKKLLSPPFAFCQQIEICLCDLLQEFLYLGVRSQTLLDLCFHVVGDRNLPHTPIAEAD
jgi:hypothetical protein